MYSLHGAELQQLTSDDSWVMMLQKESGVDARAFEKHPMRHVLTSVVGARPEVDTEVHEMELVNGQTIIPCTDGLHGGLTDAMIRSIPAGGDRSAARRRPAGRHGRQKGRQRQRHDPTRPVFGIAVDCQDRYLHRP